VEDVAKLEFVKGTDSIFAAQKSPPSSPLTNPSEGAESDSADGGEPDKSKLQALGFNILTPSDRIAGAAAMGSLFLPPAGLGTNSQICGACRRHGGVRLKSLESMFE